MKFADPLAVKCPRCASESHHNSKELLARMAVCPRCGSPFDEVGKQIGAMVDEASAVFKWAEVLMGVEERLGIPSPGIADGEVFGTEPCVDLTLLDLVRVVAGHTTTMAEATGLVLESVGQVAGRPISAAEMGLPILQVFRVSQCAYFDTPKHQ